MGRKGWRRGREMEQGQEGEEAEGMEGQMEVKEAERGAGRTSPQEVVVWVDMAWLEGERAAKVEAGEKMRGWMECRVLLSEGLCGLCPGKQCWPPSYFHRLTV